jgi:hypothetical protein
VLASLRGLCRPYELQLLPRTRSLAYFQPITAELQQHSLPDGYLDYLHVPASRHHGHGQPGRNPKTQVLRRPLAHEAANGEMRHQQAVKLLYPYRRWSVAHQNPEQTPL